MRGKVPTFHPPSGAVGITPAYAGKRRLCVVAAHLGRDHPRVCGEKRQYFIHVKRDKGSPPRMRGKVTYDDDHVPGMRITPAYAGKRRRDNGQKNKSGDHPRVCGEKYCCTLIACLSWGSPPRMRGKDALSFMFRNSPGITPAYAGKSQPDRQSGCSYQDHPRVCGEKNGCKNYGETVKGSPPRMRGKD